MEFENIPQELSPATLEILNLLQAVGGVDQMIKLHSEGGDERMLAQYQEKREMLFSQLNEVLGRELKLKLVKA